MIYQETEHLLFKVKSRETVLLIEHEMCKALNIAGKAIKMNQVKNLLPFISAIGVYFFSLNSPMYQQMNQHHSVENEIKSIPVESFK